MDNYCKLAEHVTLSSLVRRVICVLVILSLGHSYQVSNQFSSFYFYYKVSVRRSGRKVTTSIHVILQLQSAGKEIESTA